MFELKLLGPSQKEVYKVIEKNPGATNYELALIMNKTYNWVRAITQKLKQKELLRIVKVGREHELHVQ